MPILGEKLLILPLDLYNRSVAALISSIMIIIMLGNCKVMKKSAPGSNVRAVPKGIPLESPTPESPTPECPTVN